MFPTADHDALATAVWALAHGLASLHLDGKLQAEPRTAVDHRVRAAIRVMLERTPA